MVQPSKPALSLLAAACLVALGVIPSAAKTVPAEGGVTPKPRPAGTAAPAGAIAPSADFLKYWKSGLAELSSYAVATSRYGENRKAQAVLVFVYEEIDDQTRIKVESDKVPPERHVPVLKLNHVLKFNTGVYDYSLMTSVFAGLSGPGVGRLLEPRKISFSSQEWCGNVFHQVLPRPKGLVSTLHSYFEAEGDSEAVLPWPKEPVYYEDEMPILVRELDGEIWKAGESRAISMVPSLWERRKRHAPLAFQAATLAKHGTEEKAWRGNRIKAVKWTLSWPGHAMSYWVEDAKPRRLIAWDDGKNERGELIASLRKTYWETNHVPDEALRKDLGLNYGVGSGG